MSSSDDSTAAWINQSITGGSLKHYVDLTTGTNGWASPPGNLFNLRSKSYFSNKNKPPSEDYLLAPAGVDWLKSTSKLVPTTAPSVASRKPRKSFLFTVNLQVPRRNHHSAVFYFAALEPIDKDDLLYKFVNGDNAFRNSRFKIVKGSWIVKTAVGSYSGRR